MSVQVSLPSVSRYLQHVGRAPIQRVTHTVLQHSPATFGATQGLACSFALALPSSMLLYPSGDQRHTLAATFCTDLFPPIKQNRLHWFSLGRDVMND